LADPFQGPYDGESTSAASIPERALRVAPPDLKHLSDLLLRAVLDDATQEEVLTLTRLIQPDATRPMAFEALIKGIGLASGNSVANFVRAGEGVSYSQLLYDAANSLEVKDLHRYWRHSTHYGTYRIAQLDRINRDSPIDVSFDNRVDIVYKYVSGLERAILAKLMQVAYDKATIEQRQLVDAKLAELARTPQGKDLVGLKSSAALLVVGNLGGFATYTMMSTVLSAVSFGTLGFGAYTLASSALSVLLGPVGWLGLATAAAYKLGSPGAAKVIQMAATCALVCERLRASRA